MDYKKLSRYPAITPETVSAPKRRRGRPSLAVSTDTFNSLLVISQDNIYGLYMRGVIDGSTILAFRDAMFTAIGHQPEILRLHLTGITDISDIGVNHLLTTARVAAIMHVKLDVVLVGALKTMMEESGLLELIKSPSISVEAPPEAILHPAQIRKAA